MAGGRQSSTDELGDDFRYLFRIANSDIDGQRPIRLGLTSIRGVGRRVADSICMLSGLDGSRLGGTLSDEEIAQLSASLEKFPEVAPIWMLNRQRDLETGDELHLYGQDLSIIQDEDISRERMTKSYAGVRHAGYKKVRGQRTRSNGRRGLTLGVSRKK